MNRNSLKIIAVLTMLIDHLGLFFFDNFWVMRLIGRLAFPIFAFFIAEGWIKTHDRKRYVMNLLIFALISQIPYGFLHNFWNFNILFTFLLAILCIYLLENYQKHSTLYMIYLILLTSLLAVTDMFNIFDYGFFGVLLVVCFYFFRNKKLLFYLLSSGVLLLLTLRNFIFSSFDTFSLIQLFSIASIGLIALYNGEKGRLNLKWLFYIFYPLHLTIILIVSVLI